MTDASVFRSPQMITGHGIHKSNDTNRCGQIFPQKYSDKYEDERLRFRIRSASYSSKVAGVQTTARNHLIIPIVFLPAVFTDDLFENRYIRYGGKQQHTCSELDDVGSENAVGGMLVVEHRLCDLY